jgi:RecA-family ATPase
VSDVDAIERLLGESEPPPEEEPDVHFDEDRSAAARSWLMDAADLLAEPDPGPTPWLIENLIVDGAIVAAVGRWKTTKSYSLLDLCVCIATGRPAFGELEIPEPGPVIFVNEESGRKALWRRLDALARGRAIDPEQLRGLLHVAANARVKLDDPGWQRELVDRGLEIKPRLFVFDPLSRMKAPGREENEQAKMSLIVEYLRELRAETGAAVGFVHRHAEGSREAPRGADPTARRQPSDLASDSMISTGISASVAARTTGSNGV